MALGLLRNHPLELDKPKVGKRPRIEVQASIDDAPPSEWGSLLGDLARPSGGARGVEVDWRVHDKTHLEFAIDYPFDPDHPAYTWEAFFFVPDSFRLDATTYDKKDMYEDLLSYVRLAVPELPFEQLGRREVDEGEPHGREVRILSELERALKGAENSEDGSDASRIAIRRARVFACLVRASGLDAQRTFLAQIDGPQGLATAAQHTARFTKSVGEVARSYRAILATAAKRSLPHEVNVALKWVDEDMSLVLETLIANASVRIHEKAQGPSGNGPAEPAWSDIAARLAAEAVAEARYREEHEYPSVGRGDASPREMEHIEFRRHMLKRFTSSVLWLKHEVRDGASWIVQGLYALAAAVAMAFAVFATLRASQLQGYASLYVLLLVASYAIKDRMKAMLQAAFSKWAERRFPDRRWTIRDVERGEAVGSVRERAGFRPFSNLPSGVLDARRLTREHALEESARPEKVLWHEKAVSLGERKAGTLPSPMLTEIFRLNIGPWLAHTDDPNRTITFADPTEACIYSATARRVYNINVVYRLRRGAEDSSWSRIRVVVSRKGIERIDPIA